LPGSNFVVDLNTSIIYMASRACFIRLIYPNGTVSTFLSPGASNYDPSYVTIDSSLNVYFINAIDNYIYKVNANTRAISLFLNYVTENPQGLATDSEGNLWFTTSTRLVKVSLTDQSQIVASTIYSGWTIRGPPAVTATGTPLLLGTYNGWDHHIVQYDLSNSQFVTYPSGMVGCWYNFAVDSAGTSYVYGNTWYDDHVLSIYSITSSTGSSYDIPGAMQYTNHLTADVNGNFYSFASQGIRKTLIYPILGNFIFH
jgi:hypothetical protein